MKREHEATAKTWPVRAAPNIHIFNNLQHTLLLHLLTRLAVEQGSRDQRNIYHQNNNL